MNTIRTLLAAAAVLAAAGTPAFAAPLTVTATGESFSVQYDAGYTGNIVGGGVIASETQGKDSRVVYGQANHVMGAGVPVPAGGSEGDITYVPLASSGVMAAR